jgi:flagellar secretion chaperone FliS
MTGNQFYAHRYRETAINTANPLQLVVMLYDAAICSLQEARIHIENKNIAERSKSLNKCISIITELQACLDHKAGGEIASSLERLYDFMKRNIFKASFEQNAQPLIETEALLENLRAAWRQLIAQPVTPTAYTPGQHMPAGTPAQPSSMQPKSFSVSI